MNQKYIVGAALLAVLYIIFMLSKKYTIVPKTQPKKVVEKAADPVSDEKDS